MKPNKKTKLKWIADALFALLHGHRYSCCSFYEKGGIEAEMWYAKTTCEILERLGNWVKIADFEGDWVDVSDKDAKEHRLLWVLWLREMVRNNEL